MNKPRPWTALFAVLLLVGGCKDFFHPEGPTKVPPPPLTDEQAAEAFRETETVKEALEINAGAIDLDVPTEELVALETKVDEALAAYEELSPGTRSALSAEKAKLDGVKEKIGHVYSAHGFRDDHTVILARLPGEIETEEVAAALLPVLEAAPEAIGALPEGAQELLAEDTALLESLKEKAEELTAPPPPPVQHTITFDSHRGSELPPVTANEGTPVTKPADPTRTGGYRFLGWFPTTSGGTAYTWPHDLTADLTLHAQWIRQYTITFDTHGGSPVLATTADTGTPVNKPDDPARTGYGFDGWFASGGTKYDWPYAISADITMHAQWTAITYTVQYNPNGGAGTMEPSAHTYDTAKDLAGNGFARSGYTFKQWAAAPNGSGAVHTDKASVFNLSDTAGAVIDLYAQWTAIDYTIAYHLDGGDNHPANPAKYTIESPAIPLEKPTRMISVNHRIRGTTKKKNFNHKGAEGAQRKDKIEEIDPSCALVRLCG
jgi:uncharacterized repeat protein (TIGR02543 family)